MASHELRAGLKRAPYIWKRIHRRPRPDQCQSTVHLRASRYISTAPLLRSEFTTDTNVPKKQTFQAARPTKYLDVHDHPTPLLERIRLVPTSPSYFTQRPNFTDTAIRIRALYQQYKTLPLTAEPTPVVWSTRSMLESSFGGEKIKLRQHREVRKWVNRLHAIDPAFMPPRVPQALAVFKRAQQPSKARMLKTKVDAEGKAVGVGRRKTSSVRAWLVEGEGEVLVNDKTITQMFGRVHDRESALWPLRVTNRTDKYNVWAICKGGGVTGQAEAMMLAVARALVAHEPALKSALRRAGCLQHDPRQVERKKPGHLKARKMPTWVKR